jgi:hypothetical protein
MISNKPIFITFSLYDESSNHLFPTGYDACCSPESTRISFTIPQAKTEYTIIATSVDGSKTEVVSTPRAIPLRNIPSKGKIKTPVMP